jgi:hypothetical protein
MEKDKLRRERRRRNPSKNLASMARREREKLLRSINGGESLRL